MSAGEASSPSQCRWMRRPRLYAWVAMVISMESPVSLLAQAQDQPPSQTATRSALQEKFERIDEFRLSEGPDGARGRFFLSGDLTPRGQRPAVQANVDPAFSASAALTATADLLKIDASEFSPRQRTESRDDQGVTHRRYDFMFQGWRVEDFELVTLVRDDGTLIAVSGNVVRYSSPALAELRATANQVKVGAAEAQAIVLRSLEGVQNGSPSLERVIVPGSPYFFWTVDVGTRNPLGAWRYYVDAQSGVVRNRVDLMVR